MSRQERTNTSEQRRYGSSDTRHQGRRDDDRGGRNPTQQRRTPGARPTTPNPASFDRARNTARPPLQQQQQSPMKVLKPAGTAAEHSSQQTSTTPSTGGPPSSWAALLGGKTPRSPVAPAASPTADNGKQQEKQASPQQPVPETIREEIKEKEKPQQPAPIAKERQDDAPVAPLRPAPWARGPPGSLKPISTTAASSISNEPRKDDDAGASKTPTSAPGVSPRSFSFQRGNGVVLVHEAPPVSEHHHHHTPPVEKKPTAAAAAAPVAMSWAQKAKEVASLPAPRAAPKSSPSPKKSSTASTPRKEDRSRRKEGGGGRRQASESNKSALKKNHPTPNRSAEKRIEKVEYHSVPNGIVDAENEKKNNEEKESLVPPAAALVIKEEEEEKTSPPPPPQEEPLEPNEALEMLCSSLASWQLRNSQNRVQPRGIKNPGNLCFVNAVLQGLMGSASFCRLVYALRSAEPSLDNNTFPVLAAMAAVAVEFKERESFASTSKHEASKDSDNSNGKKKDDLLIELGGQPVSSALVMELIRQFSPRQQSVSEGQVEQEDAHEFLHFLLDKMHSELLILHKKLNKKPLNHSEEDHSHQEEAMADDDDDDDDGWLVKSGKRAVKQQEVGITPSEPASAITALFQGKMATSVACAGTPNSVTVHPFQIVEVPIFSDSIRSINDAFEALTAPETLEDYKPSGNAPAQQAAKTERFLQMPEILILHLMRFQFTGKSTKVNKYVGFDPKLTMKSSWLAPGSTDRGANYDLVATVTHHGKSITSGHYTADVVQPDGRWLRFDDSDVFIISKDQVVADRPYLLVYQRNRG